MPAESQIPDADRYVAYPVVGLTTAFPVPFALYSGTPAEAKLDLDVRINGVSTSAFTVTGTFNQDSTPHVCLNATVVLNTAVSGVEVTIQSAWRPRRIDQFPESQRVPPRNLNAVMNAVTAGLRDAFQRSRSTLLLPPGEASTQLPGALTRADMVLSFDETGQPEAILPKGTILGAASSAAAAAASAIAAAASAAAAAAFNPSLYLTKADNLASVANKATARNNLQISATNTPFSNSRLFRRCGGLGEPPRTQFGDGAHIHSSRLSGHYGRGALPVQEPRAGKPNAGCGLVGVDRRRHNVCHDCRQ
jgi:hypothetical protein